LQERYRCSEQVKQVRNTEISFSVEHSVQYLAIDRLQTAALTTLLELGWRKRRYIYTAEI